MIKISHLYLELLDTLDRMEESFKICNKKTFFEIGGGFGINVHLMVELFNIKKLFSATAVVNVKKDSFFVQGHFPGQPVMPGVLIVEAFGQAAAALTAHGIDPKEYANKLVYLMGVDKARFRNPVLPDCCLLYTSPSPRDS